MSLWGEYKRKLIGADEAAALVESGQWVDYNFALAGPVELDAALARRRGELRDVKIRGGLRLSPLAAVEGDPERESFLYHSWHFSAYERRLHERGLADHIPMVYRHMPLHYRKSLGVDVDFCAVSPMDDRGYFSLSLTNSAGRAIAGTARKVVLEVNEKLPPIKNGRENALHLSEVDYVVEAPPRALPSLAPAPFGEIERRIAGYVVGRMRDGSVLQIGVGALPNAVGSVIAESGLRDLGAHTEMLVDAYKDLHLSGHITNRLKKADAGRSVFSFCLGSQELYDWAGARGDMLESRPVDYVNDPSVMAAHESLIAVNACLEVDLLGQVSSEASGFRQISGTGGQLDFTTGGYQSPAGSGFICFASTFADKKTGEIKSRVRATLTPGSVVSVPRSQAHCLVTEWGLADLAGRSAWERADRIIGLAHPDFRDGLISEARALGLWRRSNKIA